MAFHYLCPAGRSYLTMADFSTIIDNKDACRDAYNVFDVDGDGTITKSEFKGALVRIFREQRNLAQNVANTGSALSILNTIGKVVSTAGLFLLLLAIMGVKVQNILGFSASFIFAMNFIIMDSANKTFSSLLFLFVVHPYDIGDRVLIGKEAGHSDEEILTVLHINIQNTVFKRWNGLLVTMPNHVLAVGPLTNLSRGGEQWERVEFSILAPDHSRLSVDEETEKLADLRRQIEAFLISNNKDYYQSFELRAVVAADYGAADKNFDALKFILKIRCKDTVDSQRKWTRHARILAFVKQVVPSAGVKFSA
jgi:small-conductance mechanosensitive channel